MKADLVFDLPDEDADLRHALAGSKLVGVILDANQLIRSYKKHGGSQERLIECLDELMWEGLKLAGES
jgi:hypothetical protein